MKHHFFIYLAGPITGASYEECITWRQYVAKKLPSYIKAISPTFGEAHLEGEVQIKDCYNEQPLGSQRGITAKDRFHVMRSDLVLVNLIGAKRISIGTVMEIAWADAFRKPIVLAIDKDNLHNHAMLREVCSFALPNLDDAIKVATTLLSSTF